ncbi:MAG: redox-sensing transcriptional repressor Rex [Clostridiales bacterium]|nr:redox-sensing transcriptional repressor Rex [Clostridiales bacterium]MCD7828568.1 redox-sensing transcriptional repressor Rex [Clostridiales bacterium]
MGISQTVIRRLPSYLHYLRQLPDETVNVSATAIAGALGLGDVQVRKDLALICGGGKPKIGYDRLSLINSLETRLGYKDKKLAVIAGAGKLGSAFLEFKGFEENGLNIVAAFDNDISKVGYSDSGKYIYPMSDFCDFCKTEHVLIGVITVPWQAAQSVCDMMSRSGIKAIWNFAPVKLEAPDDILIQNENLASSLALLSSHLT